MNNCFLFEMFCEELPHHTQLHIEKEWTKHAEAIIAQLPIASNYKLTVFSTPRRVALQLHNLPLSYQSEKIYKKGPKIDNSSAVSAFLAKYSQNFCYKDSECWHYEKPAEKMPIENLLYELTQKLAFETTGHKMMRWGSEKTVWFRPVHSIICMLNDKVLPFEYGSIKSGNITQGHRFFKQNYIDLAKELVIDHASNYENILSQNKVIALYKDRIQNITHQIQNILNANSLHLKTNEALIEKIAGLVEYPTVCIGNFSKEFLNVPFEVIETALKNHQNAFALYDINNSIVSKFLFISNAIHSSEEEIKIVIAGNEKVVAARLSDASFFWNIDKNIDADEYENRIAKKVYFDKLGTLKDKVNRMQKIKEIILQTLNCGVNKVDLDLFNTLQTTIQYSKYDLCTELVREFPELQGVVGAHYYITTNADNDIFQSIHDQYLLYFDKNTKLLTRYLSFIDNLDKIVGFFSIGIKPTSAGDPFALRRSGNIIASILCNIEMNIEQLRNIIINTSKLFQNNCSDEVLSFILERFEKLVCGNGCKVDLLYASNFTPIKFSSICQAIEIIKFINTNTFAHQIMNLSRRLSGLINQIQEKYKKYTIEMLIDTYVKNIKSHSKSTLLANIVDFYKNTDSNNFSELYINFILNHHETITTFLNNENIISQALISDTCKDSEINSIMNEKTIITILAEKLYQLTPESIATLIEKIYE